MNNLSLAHPNRRMRAAVIVAFALACALALTFALAGAARADGGTPTVSVSPGQGPVGASITATGDGYGKGDTVVIGYSPSATCANPTAIPGATGTSDGNGGISIPFPWPNTPAGSFYICSTDQTTGKTAHSNQPYKVVPQAALTINQPIYSGQTVTVTGKGFQAPGSSSNGTVEVHYGPQGSNGCTTAAGTATVNPDGSFSATFPAPHADNPTPIVVVGDEPTGTCGSTQTAPVYQGQASATVYPLPSLSAPTSVKTGDTIHVTGKNYWPANSTVQVLYGPSGTGGCATVVGTTTSGSDGSITEDFKAPKETSNAVITTTGVIPVGGCTTSPVKAQADTAVTTSSPGLPFPIQWCLIGLLLLLLLLLLLFLVFRGRGPAPVTIEERDTLVVPPGGRGGAGGASARGAAPFIDRQIVARQGGKEVVIAEEITTVEEEEEDVPS